MSSPAALVSLPIEYLHLETGVIFLFLVVLVRSEFGRAASPNYDVQSGFPVLRWLPLAFIVMAAALSGLLLHTSPLLGVELAAGITLSLLHPVNALCFMVLLMFLRPWEIAVGDPVLMLIPRFGVLLCFFSWLLHTRFRAKITLRKHLSVIYLLAFSGWLLVTTIKTPSITAGVSDWFATYFKSLTIFGAAVFLIESERSVHEVELTFVFSSLSLMAVGFYQYLSGAMTSGRLQSSGMLGDPNDMGAIIVMSLPFALGPVFDEATGPLTKIAGLTYGALALVVIWLTRSRGTMLAVVAQFLVVRLVHSKGKRLSLILTAFILAFSYIGLMRVLPRRADDMDASEASRITFWKTAGNMAFHSPFLGVGFHQYPENYMYYLVGTAYERGNRTAHSSWFLALGESGFVGFYFFVLFFASIARIAWQNRMKRPAQLYAVAGYGVAMSFLSHTYSPYYFLLMALVLASANVKGKVHHGA